jgi:hypothetical protein
MRGKSIVTGVLLAFVAVSILYLVVKERRTQPASLDRTEHPAAAQASEENVLNASAADHMLVVYYFHGNKRCYTCRTIEAYTEEAIKMGFPEELESGRLVWKAVNVDDPANEHFVEDYDLTTRTVVLVDVDRGSESKWAKLDRVWELVQNKEEFVDYITENTNAYLTEHDG